jgi:hypothetical protein
MIIYYINGEKFTSENYDDIPWLDISSPDENTPAYEDLETGQKIWCEKNNGWHRLTGPAYSWPTGREEFYLNGTRYKKVKDWLKVHPYQDNAFQVEMLLKYT